MVTYCVFTEGLHSEHKVSIICVASPLIKEVIEVLRQDQLHVKVFQHAGETKKRSQCPCRVALESQ